MRLHSWLSPACRVADSPLAGIGVFAASRFSAGDLVAVWGGVIFSSNEIQQLGAIFPQFHTHPVAVAQSLFLGSTSLSGIDDAERFNHSCAPNVGIKGQIVVLARRDIEAGEELTFEYETTDPTPATFHCRCGTMNCRGVVDGSAWQRLDFQKQHAGWLSWYMVERIEQV